MDHLKNNHKLNLFRVLAMLVSLAGAVVSLFMTLHAGRNNASVLLPILFVVWVLSPFVALLAANFVFKSWSKTMCLTLYSLMIFLSIASVVGYSGLLSPANAKPAGIFLLVPLLSWLLIAIVMPIVASISKKRLQQNDNL